MKVWHLGSTDSEVFCKHTTENLVRDRNTIPDRLVFKGNIVGSTFVGYMWAPATRLDAQSSCAHAMSA
eukprot:1744065-Amphidinium_carterae.1